jgi:hypothetical protein
METETRVLSVEDHGMWRGRRTWTIRVDGPTGTAQVSAVDVDTSEAAIEQALDTYAQRHVFTSEERAAMKRTNEALSKGMGLL